MATNKKLSAPEAKSPSRAALLVMGMHRSGTSALTGVIGHMGADLPNDLMASSEMNAKGFFESNRITQFDENLLASAGFTWWDCRRFPAAWFTSPKAGEFARRVAGELTAEYGDSALFVLKDPLICRLAPFWLPVLKENGCQPLIVHTHRHPRDVAASLEHRAGYDIDYGLLMWLRHVLDAEAETRGESRVFTSYEAVMRDWAAEVDRIGTTLGLSWPKTLPMVAPVIDDFLSRDLQHFNRKSGEQASTATLPPLVRKTYEILETWAADGERAADRARLDKLRDRLDAATESFGGLARRGQEWRYEARQYREAHHELAGTHARQQAELAAATQQIGQTDAELQRLRGEAEAANRAAQAAQADRDALQQARHEEHTRFAEERGRFEAQLGEAGQRLAGMAAELDRARGDADRAAQAVRDERDALAQAGAEERSRLQADLATAAAHLEQLTAELAAAQGGLEGMRDLESALHQAREERDVLAQAGAEDRARLQADLAAAAAHLDELTAELAAARAGLEGMKDLEAALHQARSALIQREEETDQLRRQLEAVQARSDGLEAALEHALVAQGSAEQERARVTRQLARLTAQMTATMQRGLSSRLARIEAEARQSAAAEPTVADEAGEPPSAVVAAEAAGTAVRPASATLTAPRDAVAQGERKRKRPHDGVKPPFRGLKRLWRKARGRGVPRV